MTNLPRLMPSPGRRASDSCGGSPAVDELEQGGLADALGRSDVAEFASVEQAIDRPGREAEQGRRLTPGERQALIAAQAALVADLLWRLRRERIALSRLLDE